MTVRVVIEADGGSRGNPGPAGYGAVVRDAATGEVLAERSEGIGVATNNVAEYAGLIAGLRAALELGAREAEIRLDSKLVVEQMRGRWKVRQAHLQPLVAEAVELVRKLDRVEFNWVPRALNTHADRLANEAMDTQAGRATTAASASAQTTRSVAWSGAIGEPTRLLLLRHAQTLLSAARRYSGRGDPALTEVGERQAVAAARRLSTIDGIAAVVSSPLRRAIATAQPLAEVLGLPVTIHEGLVEADFGAWEGLTFSEARERDPVLHARWLSDTGVAAPGGESLDAVHDRVRRVRDELAGSYGGNTLVLVSHVTPIKSLLRMALAAGPSVLHRMHLDIASLSTAEFYPDGFASVLLVNDTAHLH